VNEAPQDMMIIRAKAMLGEGDAIPSTDGFAETLETVVQSASHRISPAICPVDMKLINRANAALRRFELSPKFSDPLCLRPGCFEIED
jgi:hypothetical protein